MLGNEIFLSSVYLAGILSFFSPCIFPLLPVYFGILGDGEKSSILKTILFVLGLSICFVLLGFGAGTLGDLLMSDTFRVIGGFIVIFFGLFQMDLIRISFLNRTKLLELNSQGNGVWSAFLLGFSFSLGWTPCIGPVLASILFISSGGGSATYGAFLMGVYVMGLATPFLIFSLSSKYFLSKTNFIKKHLEKIKKVSGALIVIMGILLLTNKLGIFLQISI